MEMSCYVLDNKQKIYYPENACPHLISELMSNVTDKREWEIALSDKYEATVGEYEKADTNGFEYVVNVTEKGIYIGGESYAAVAHGYVDLIDRVKYDYENDSFFVECGTWREKPAVGFRCVHLCLFPETTLRSLQKSIRAAGAVKYSHLIIEFWGTFKYDSFKELAWSCGYTKEELKPYLDEARALGMEIIPMFNHLGHATSCRGKFGKHVVLDQNPKLSYLFNYYGWEWNYKLPEVRERLRGVRKELMELCGEGKYFHLGCDEAQENMDAEYGYSVAEYINEIQSELEKEGRRAIIWADMLLCREEFKNATEKTEANSRKETADALVNTVSKNVVIADWQYAITADTWVTSKYFVDKGFDVVCCPWEKINNARAALRNTLNLGLMGEIHTTWHTLFVTFPTMVYSGTVMWGGEEAFGIEWFGARMHAAEILRKFCPGDGSFEDASWTDKTVGPAL